LAETANAYFGRKYPYYVCRNAQRNGWSACPSKTLPAQTIEESVLGRVRQTERVADATPWEEMDRSRQIEVMQALLERVGYNGTTRQFSIRLRVAEVAVTAQEARA